MENGARKLLAGTGWFYLFCVSVNILILLPVAKEVLFEGGSIFALVVTLFFLLFFILLTVYCLAQAWREDISAEKKIRISGISFNILGTLTCVISAIAFIVLTSRYGGDSTATAFFVFFILFFAALFLTAWIWHHVGGLYMASIVSIVAGFMLAPLSLPQMVTGTIALVLLDRQKKAEQTGAA